MSGERKTVGAIAFTLMPCVPHSQASAFVVRLTAAFDAQYAVYPAGWPRSLRVDETSTNLPRVPASIIRRPAARQTSQVPFALASSTDCQSSGDCSVASPTLLTPAAVTTRSMPPCAETAVSTIASACASVSARRATVSTAAPPSRSSEPSCSSASAPPAASVSFAPRLDERLRGHLPERAGRAGDQRRLAGDVEQLCRVHGFPGGYGITTIIDAGRFVRFSIERASFGAR